MAVHSWTRRGRPATTFRFTTDPQEYARLPLEEVEGLLRGAGYTRTPDDDATEESP